MPVAVPARGVFQQGQRRHDKYDWLVAAARSLPKLKVAVAHPCDAASLGAVLEATELGLIEPILVGRREGVLAELAHRHGIADYTTDLDAALADPRWTIYADFLVTKARAAALRPWSIPASSPR